MAMLLLAAVTLSACGPFGGDAYAFHGTELPPPNPAPPLALTDQTGQPWSVAAQTGDDRVSVLFFGFTNCPDVCPTTLVDFTRIKAALGERAAGVDFVFITVDPARDTPERIAEYLTFFDPGFTGLTGTPEQLAAVRGDFGVYAQAKEPDATGAYSVDHTAATFVIDRDGNYRLTYGYGTDPALIAEDLGHLVPD